MTPWLLVLLLVCPVHVHNAADDNSIVESLPPLPHEPILPRHHPTAAAPPYSHAHPSVATPAPSAPYPDSHVQCSASWDTNNWPTFHLLNNVTQRPNGALDMEDLNDANAIFPYRGLWHAMFQSGDGPPPYGWRWAHKVSNDLVHWYPVADALAPGMTKNTTWDDKGACDGTLSFPDLGEAPFDGGAPVILYGPDCGVTVPFDVAVPANPADPYLADWVNSGQPGHVTFDGIECQFPGRVWKSSIGPYWNMLCSLGAKGTGHWARFTSHDASLMHWTYSNATFIEGAVAGGFSQGPLFHRIPNAPATGPTHLINNGKGDSFLLGTYDATREVMVVTSLPQRLDCATGDNFNWVTTGPNGPDPAIDSGRLLIVAWVYGPPAPSSMSLIRDISYDAAARQLVSFPVPEYTLLRTHAVMQHQNLGVVGPGVLKTLPLPAGVGGSADILLSFELRDAVTAADGFGLAVRAPSRAYAGAAAVTMTVNHVGASDADGNRNVSMSFVTPDPKADHDSNANATVLLLRGEALDVRVLIDKSVVEFFVMGGRAAYVACDVFYSLANSSVHIFNAGTAPVTVSNVSAYQMGCGWAHTKPLPAEPSEYM